jgi:hypothetical protein
MYWVIQYASHSPCWIQEEERNVSFHVTYQLKFAQRFMSGEDARNEMLRLGLSGDWTPIHYGGRSE